MPDTMTAVLMLLFALESLRVERPIRNRAFLALLAGYYMLTLTWR
jgi:hypothetical protein